MTERTFPEGDLMSEGIRLRQFTRADIPQVLVACEDSETQKWVPIPSPYELKDAEFFVNQFSVDQKESGRGIVFAIEIEGSLVGSIDISNTSWDNFSCSTGYWAVPSHRGKGHMSKALTLVSNWAIKDHGFKRIDLYAATENFVSQRVAENAGFKREGVARNRVMHRGQILDLISYSKIPSDIGF